MKKVYRNWAAAVLNTSNLSEPEKITCLQLAYRVINEGGMRGDISDEWAKKGHTPLDIPNMLV